MGAGEENGQAVPEPEWTLVTAVQNTVGKAAIRKHFTEPGSQADPSIFLNI